MVDADGVLVVLGVDRPVCEAGAEVVVEAVEDGSCSDDALVPAVRWPVCEAEPDAAGAVVVVEGVLAAAEELVVLVAGWLVPAPDWLDGEAEPEGVEVVVVVVEVVEVLEEGSGEEEPVAAGDWAVCPAPPEVVVVMEAPGGVGPGGDLPKKKEYGEVAGVGGESVGATGEVDAADTGESADPGVEAPDPEASPDVDAAGDVEVVALLPLVVVPEEGVVSPACGPPAAESVAGADVGAGGV